MNWGEVANDVIPGGVNSPVRAFHAVESPPLYIRRARGCRLYTEDNRILVDYCMSWGASLLGHASRPVTTASRQALADGTSFGLCHRYEVLFAEMIRRLIPSMEKIRFVSSGTEAVMSAIRLARGYTGRKMILKFDGCYHGHSDSLLVSAGSGLAGHPQASSSGVPEEIINQTLSIPYNDIEQFRQVMSKEGSRIACVIVEPVAGNMGLVLPEAGFLEALREETEKYGALLIFDEVITGFRFHAGGYQDLAGIRPDLTTLGKIIGGGFPVGALGGRQDIMDSLAPEGHVYQAGTLSGNPVGMRAGLAVVSKLAASLEIYDRLNDQAAELSGAMRDRTGLTVNQLGSLFTLFFTSKPVRNFKEAGEQDPVQFRRFWHTMIKSGIFFPPSMFEASFVSTAHKKADIQKTINALSYF